MITKQAIKNYLDFTNKDLEEKLKSTIENSDNWSNFKSDLIDLLLTYDKNPSSENKTKIDSLISRNYISNSLDAREALDKILNDLHIGQQEKSDSKVSSGSDSKSEVKKLYESLGLEYDIDDQSQGKGRNSQVSSKDIAEFRKKYHSHDKFFTAKSKRTEGRDTGNDNKKEDGGVKRTLKLAYFKLTASMLIAPGKVPPEILSKNKDLIDESSKKLDVLLADLKKAKETVSGRNKNQKDKMGSGISSYYEAMLEGNDNDEEKIKKCEEHFRLEKKLQMSDLKESISNIIQNTKLEDKVRAFAEQNFPNMPKEELEEEIKYALLDSKVDKKGNLILPKRSIFKDLLFDENGKIQSGKLDIVNTIKTNCEFLKVTDLSETDIKDIAKDFKYGSHESIFKNPSKARAFRDFLSTHVDLVNDDYDNIVSNIIETYDRYNVTENLLEETEITHKMILAEKIQGQFEEIKRIVREYDDKERKDGSLNKEDAKKRELALKIARRKVKSLERAKLSKVIEQGKKKSNGVIKRARGILVPHLENTVNRDSKKFEKNFEQEQEEQEQ